MTNIHQARLHCCGLDATISIPARPPHLPAHRDIEVFRPSVGSKEFEQAYTAPRHQAALAVYSAAALLCIKNHLLCSSAAYVCSGVLNLCVRTLVILRIIAKCFKCVFGTCWIMKINGASPLCCKGFVHPRGGSASPCASRAFLAADSRSEHWQP